MLPAVTDERIAKWTRWIEGSIEGNVLNMHLHRDTWREVAKMIDDHGQLPDSYWWEFLFETYAITQAVAVRRQADTHKDVASLAKLVEEIRDDAARITRDYWLGLWTYRPRDPGMRRVAEKAWDDQYAGSVGTHLDPAIPTADLDALIAAVSSVKGHVDQHVAHADGSAAPASVTLKLSDVHDAIDVIGDVFRRYSNLLTASTMYRLVPVIQHDWKAVFREAWIRRGT
jgi:hypothetical protein